MMSIAQVRAVAISNCNRGSRILVPSPLPVCTLHSLPASIGPLTPCAMLSLRFLLLHSSLKHLRCSGWITVTTGYKNCELGAWSMKSVNSVEISVTVVTKHQIIDLSTVFHSKSKKETFTVQKGGTRRPIVERPV